ncbi:MAG: alpha/beta hydrolase [Planctomycetota bacterium]|nr:alpha/beta hydrolase [Planctomycetota bacterium]
MLASIRGTRIFFDIDGAGFVPDGDRLKERPILFLLHGGPGGDHTGFRGANSELRDVAQLVYVDHRGCGRSDTGNPADYTLENNIDDLDALRAHLGLETISVLGSSYGGMVAIGYALRYPKRVANLILVCTAASYRFLDDAQKLLAERGTPEQIQVCRRLWDGNFDSMEQLRDYYRVMGPLYSRKFQPEDFDAGWNRGRRSYLAISINKNQAAARLPWHSREIADAIPRAHLKIFDHSGHSVAADEPAEYLRAIRGFLTYATPPNGH